MSRDTNNTCNDNNGRLEEPFKITTNNNTLSVAEIGYKLSKAFAILNGDLPAEKEGKAYAYLSEAIYMAEEIMPHVIRDARERGLVANRVDFGSGMKELYTALHGVEQYRARGTSDRGYSMVKAALWAIESAHHKMACVLSGDPSGMDAGKNARGKKEPGFNYGYGFRHVTEADFAEFGAGGGR